MPRALLPFATPPRPDELLSSWLVRLAHDHLCKAYTFAKVLFPGVSVWNRDVDKAGPEGVLQTLAARTRVPLARIRDTVLQCYEGRLYLNHNPFGNTDWILPLGIYHRTHRRLGLVFCPNCLRKDGPTPYFRTRWRLALAVVCPECGLWLQEKCPNCQAPVVFFRIDLGRKSELPDVSISHCFQCRFDLAQADSVPAPAHLLAGQREWYRILEEGWTTSVVYPHLYFVVLRQLAQALSSNKLWCRPLQAAMTTHVGPDLPPSIAPESLREARSFEYLPLTVRGALLQQANWLLTDWPGRFVSFMKQHRIASTPLLQDLPEIPFWYHSTVQQHLYVNNVNRRFADFWK